MIEKNQYGLRAGKNINQLLANFSDYINKSLSRNSHVLALFVDFSKTFDTIPHGQLLKVLERSGIRGKCLNWVKNYFLLRTYRVKVCGTYSEERNVDLGVPQGSKLGPLFYIIYTNGLLKCMKKVKSLSTQTTQQ